MLLIDVYFKCLYKAVRMSLKCALLRTRWRCPLLKSQTSFFPSDIIHLQSLPVSPQLPLTFRVILLAMRRLLLQQGSWLLHSLTFLPFHASNLQYALVCFFFHVFPSLPADGCCVCFTIFPSSSQLCLYFSSIHHYVHHVCFVLCSLFAAWLFDSSLLKTGSVTLFFLYSGILFGLFYFAASACAVGFSFVSFYFLLSCPKVT